MKIRVAFKPRYIFGVFLDRNMFDRGEDWDALYWRIVYRLSIVIIPMVPLIIEWERNTIETFAKGRRR